MARVLAAMSGGVDSSVAAAILLDEGYDVTGVSLRLWDDRREGPSDSSCGAGGLSDAARVAESLGIPHRTFDERDLFRREVLEPFVEAYRQGRTPNPCITCNSRLKFAALLRIAGTMGIGKVATGHYARLEPDPLTGRIRLLRGVDAAKDQSYFLHALDQAQREMSLFPVGGMTKKDVRAQAIRRGLPAAGRSESQDLCFLPGGGLRDYLRDRLGGGKPGEIVDRSGEAIGLHGGIQDFTIGQRRGLGLSAGRPRYVIGLDPEANRVLVGWREDLESRDLVAAGCRLDEPGLLGGPFRAEAQIRSRHEPAAATVTPLDRERLHVRFDAPQSAVTPGQALVLYRGTVVLGGGWIEAGALDQSHRGYLDYGGALRVRA